MSKQNCCDNPRCKHYHGGKKLWLHQLEHNEEDLDLENYNVIYIRSRRITLCRTCETVYDLIQHHRKAAMYDKH